MSVLSYRAISGTVVLLVAMLLAGCGQQPATVSSSLPTVPADIQTCFRGGPANVPQKALTVAEVESLWKQDRVRLVVEQRCGRRFLAWYGDLRKGWR